MIKKLLSNDFNRNVLTLLTGSTVARAIPIIISPILTRIYSPDAFGILSIFISITTILGSISNARYEVAIVLPEKEEEVINIAALSLIISTVFSTILFFIVLIFGNYILKIDSISEISIWLYFVPLVVFLIGLFNTLNYLNTKYKDFKVIAQTNVVRSFGLALIQILFGLIKSGAFGLISGQIFSHLAGNTRLGIKFIKDKVLLRKISIKEMKKVARKYKNFPKYSLGSTFLNTFSQNMVSFFIPMLYSMSHLGYYTLVQRILGLPLTLISRAIGQVFFEKASSNHNKGQSNNALVKQTLLKLTVITMLIFTPLLILVDWLIPLVFGEEWSEVSTLIYILTPLFITRFIIVPVTITNSIYDKQHLDLIWQIIFTLISFTVFILAKLLEMGIYQFFLTYSIIISVIYLLYLAIVLLVIRKGS